MLISNYFVQHSEHSKNYLVHTQKDTTQIIKEKDSVAFSFQLRDSRGRFKRMSVTLTLQSLPRSKQTFCMSNYWYGEINFN